MTYEYVIVRTRDSTQSGMVFVCEHVANEVYRQYASCHEDDAAEMIRALLEKKGETK